MRVVSLCKKIGDEEHANMDILIPAAFLHDIARPVEEETGVPHEVEGAKMAEIFLISICYPAELIQPILHAILAHRFSTPCRPQTLEACILSDADKLDALGAIGIARAFITAGERHGDISDALHHIDKKLIKLKDMMYTKSATVIALKRHDLLCTFRTALLEEMETSDM
jgi:uncharacterized protein